MPSSGSNTVQQCRVTVTCYSSTHLDLLVAAGNTRSYRVRNHRRKVPPAGNGFQSCCFPAHTVTAATAVASFHANSTTGPQLTVLQMFTSQKFQNSDVVTPVHLT